MDARETNILESFINMREFDRVNAADYKDFPDAKAQFTVINSSIEAMQEHAAKQTSGIGGRAVQQKSVLDAAIRRRMKSISRTARALNINDEGFRRLFSIPNGRSAQKLLAAAREFAEEATTHKAEFIKLGIRASFIEDLTADIEDYEQAISDKAGAQSATAGASAGIDEAVENGMEAAIIADSIMRNVYEDEPVKLAEWMRAKHVKRSPQRTPKTPPLQP